ncbi:PIR protein [Plasmodium yoelii]|uniref:PIR protein n=2 Tax=Plasmodium yoelii TaxID=5861 RepID=A0AAF0B4B7_PLAYO|nr:PIR protein [Plasmodium yoelii]WBY56969.1 PIR protein [Plasmodium yoelii yoelii]CDU17764.1 YIR protein [Plasmodium yoelii]VTZ77808.1 PIR protein [Plasmodium yoelii]|eukprot:XP_022812071.1 PIR protein [Plasmodium yoelii]
MDHRMCGRFSTLRNFLPDELNKNTSFQFHNNGNIKNYCPNGDSGEKECKTELDKINAACLWLLEQTIVNRINDLSKDQPNVFIIYIMIWLSHMLKLKNVNGINNLKDFYTNYIENNTHYTNCKKGDNDCSSSLKDKFGYNNFKEFIKENECFMSISITEMSKYYNAFKLLCEMYTEGNTDESSCTKSLEHAKEFVEKYKELSEDSSIAENSSCSQILSSLSTDYNNLKKKCNELGCNDFPLLQEIKTTQDHVKSSKDNSEQIYGQSSEATSSSSSITNKLIPVLSTFAAIPIFLGIFYKYSLFGFRKRPQKQHLREKLKK